MSAERRSDNGRRRKVDVSNSEPRGEAAIVDFSPLPTPTLDGARDGWEALADAVLGRSDDHARGPQHLAPVVELARFRRSRE